MFKILFKTNNMQNATFHTSYIRVASLSKSLALLIILCVAKKIRHILFLFFLLALIECERMWEGYIKYEIMCALFG